MDFELLLRAIDVRTQRENAMAGGAVEAGPVVETVVNSASMTEGEQVRFIHHCIC